MSIHVSRYKRVIIYKNYGDVRLEAGMEVVATNDFDVRTVGDGEIEERILLYPLS